MPKVYQGYELAIHTTKLVYANCNSSDRLESMSETGSYSPESIQTPETMADLCADVFDMAVGMREAGMEGAVGTIRNIEYVMLGGSSPAIVLSRTAPDTANKFPDVAFWIDRAIPGKKFFEELAVLHADPFKVYTSPARRLGRRRPIGALPTEQLAAGIKHSPFIIDTMDAVTPLAAYSR